MLLKGFWSEAEVFSFSGILASSADSARLSSVLSRAGESERELAPQTTVEYACQFERNVTLHFTSKFLFFTSCMLAWHLWSKLWPCHTLYAQKVRNFLFQVNQFTFFQTWPFVHVHGTKLVKTRIFKIPLFYLMNGLSMKGSASICWSNNNGATLHPFVWSSSLLRWRCFLRFLRKEARASQYRLHKVSISCEEARSHYPFFHWPRFPWHFHHQRRGYFSGGFLLRRIHYAMEGD